MLVSCSNSSHDVVRLDLQRIHGIENVCFQDGSQIFETTVCNFYTTCSPSRCVTEPGCAEAITPMALFQLMMYPESVKVSNFKTCVFPLSVPTNSQLEPTAIKNWIDSIIIRIDS